MNCPRRTSGARAASSAKTASASCRTSVLMAVHLRSWDLQAEVRHPASVAKNGGAADRRQGERRGVSPTCFGGGWNKDSAEARGIYMPTRCVSMAPGAKSGMDRECSVKEHTVAGQGGAAAK